MFAVISPAKKLDFESEAPTKKHTNIRYPDKTWQLIQALRKCSPAEISKLMKLSDSLTDLNVARYKAYKKDFGSEVGKQAMFAFNGDTYTGLEASTLSAKDIDYSQKHLGILSGLYGLLAPLDLIQPYRLEMGTRFKCEGKKNLYEYWNEIITEEINKILKKEKVLVNLSSNEYFSAIDTKSVKGEIITPVFQEKKGDQYKVIGFCAKRARGMMARYIIQNRIESPEELKSFREQGYKYNPKFSSDTEYVFTRDQQ